MTEEPLLPEEDLQEKLLRSVQDRRELQDYAERVTCELRRYQRARPSPPPGGPEDGMPLPPWATNMQLMSPLLYAYEERIAELEAVIERSAGLVEHTQALMRENDALRAELHQRTRQLREAQVVAPLGSTGLMGDAQGDGQDALAEIYRLGAEQNEVLAQQNRLLQAQVDHLQHSMADGQRQLREVQERAAMSVSAERAQLEAEKARILESARAKGSENEAMAQAWRAEQESVDALVRQGAAAEARLTEVTAELVEASHMREQSHLQVQSLEEQLLHHQGCLGFLKQSYADDRATTEEEAASMQSALARVSQIEVEQRGRILALERELAEASEQLRVATRDGDATKQEAEQMESIMESMERKLQDIGERYNHTHSKLVTLESQERDLVFERECITKSEEAFKRQAGRMESRLQDEIGTLRHQLDSGAESAQAQQERVVAALQEQLRRSEQSTLELQTRAELAEKQRTWEASAFERQSSAHSLERGRLAGDLEDLQQARIQVERRADMLQQETGQMKAELDAALIKAQEQATQEGGESAACRSRLQTLEVRLAQVAGDERACEQRISDAAIEREHLQEELRQEKLHSAGVREAERRESGVERSVLERQLRESQAKAQQEEQRALELLRSQESLYQRWQVEVGRERESLETQVERLSRENRALREKSQKILKVVAMQRAAGSEELAAALAGRMSGGLAQHFPGHR